MISMRGFARYHEVLNRSRWSPLAGARLLLGLIIRTFATHGPIVIGIDDTIERRRGSKIKARGIYRDPARSSHGRFVKASGLRWLSAMVLAPIPWAGRVWALPFLTVLMPSERWARTRRARYETLLDGARQMLLRIARWLPDRHIIVVADSSFSAIDLLAGVRRHLCGVTRIRLDARLFAPAPPRDPRRIGRPPRTGPRLPSLAQRLSDPKTARERGRIMDWHGAGERSVEIASGWKTGSGLRHFCPPTPVSILSTCSPGSSGAGRSRSLSPRSADTSGSRHGASGPTRRSHAPRLCGS